MGADVARIIECWMVGYFWLTEWPTIIALTECPRPHSVS